MKVKDLHEEYVPVEIQYNSKFGSADRKISCGLDFFTVRCLLNTWDGHNVDAVKAYWEQASTVREFCELILADFEMQYTQPYAYVALELGAAEEVISRQLSEGESHDVSAVSYVLENDDTYEEHVEETEFHILGKGKLNTDLLTASRIGKWYGMAFDVKLKEKENFTWESVDDRFYLYKTNSGLVFVRS